MTCIVETYAPKLRDQWLTLKPFDDVITSYSAGPQPQCKHDSMDELQHIDMDFSTWKNGEIIVLCIWIIRENGVFLLTDDGEHPSSMDQLWSYLRQLSRPAWSFCS
jgi:hypothetical protein